MHRGNAPRTSLAGAFLSEATITAPRASLGRGRLVAASILLGLSGAADSVSMIFRNTMLQASVPDSMRGRLQGLFTVVVMGGPRIGDLHVGVLSVTALLWMPPLLGGVVVVVAAGVILRVQRGLRGYDARKGCYRDGDGRRRHPERPLPSATCVPNPSVPVMEHLS